MKHSVQILKDKNIFSRHKYPSLNALKIKYFSTLTTTIRGEGGRGEGVSLNYPILNF